MNTLTTPLSALYHWERHRPDTVHFVQPHAGGRLQQLTWRQIMDQVRRVAAYLRLLDLPAGSHIALLGKNTAHWIMADYAIWMAGHVSVPLYPTLSADTLRYVLEHSDARLLIVGKLDDWEAMRSGIPTTLPMLTLPLAPYTGATIWDDVVGCIGPLCGEPNRRLDEVATIIYTSGTTGRPKGVMHSFRAYAETARLVRPLFPATEHDRMLSYLPLAHVGERVAVECNSTYCGFTVYFNESLATFAEDLRRARPTLFFSVPRLWVRFHQAVCKMLPLHWQKWLFRMPLLGPLIKRRILVRLGLQDVRLALTGAAPLPSKVTAWFRALGLDLLEAYGMSENMAYSHLTRVGDVVADYIGPANPEVECRISLDGEVQMKSPTLMVAYYKDPLGTASSFTADGYLRTGDMGELDDAGRLRITGRLKELFKTAKGKYVAPAPIENALGEHPRVEVVCVGGANQPAAFALTQLSEDTRLALGSGVLAAPQLEREMQSLLQSVNARLDPHERLQSIVLVKDVWGVENGFLTPTLKIRRDRIEQHYQNQLASWYETGKSVIWAA